MWRNLEKAGLNSPEITVTLHWVVKTKGKEEKKEWTLTLGKKSGDEGNVFALLLKQPRRVFALKTSTVKDLFVKDMNELRGSELPGVDPTNSRRGHHGSQGQKEG